MKAAVVLLMLGWTYAAMVADPPSLPSPPEKSWVWLTSQGCWGWGYKRADGYWVIDPGSKRYPFSH